MEKVRTQCIDRGWYIQRKDRGAVDVVSADMRQLALDMRLCSARLGAGPVGLGSSIFDATAGSVLPGVHFFIAGKCLAGFPSVGSEREWGDVFARNQYLRVR